MISLKLEENLFYWKTSLENLEPIIDDFYIFDELIIKDQNLLQKADKLRELIITYCVLVEKQQENTDVAEEIFKDIFHILSSVKNIQYHEFVAFWKVLDISYSVFNKIKKQNIILKEILKKYCQKRRNNYDNLGYSNVTIQALYDVGASRKKGNAGNIKIENLIQKFLKGATLINNISSFDTYPVAYFFADRGGSSLFNKFRQKFNLTYKFEEAHQGKICDVVLKVNDHFFLIEAKHMKEGGGAQDKQVAEVIEFIKFSEEDKHYHYVTFMDGVYFNKFSKKVNSQKILRQKNDIENNLKDNECNFFVNTFGLSTLLFDLSKEVSDISNWK